MKLFSVVIGIRCDCHDMVFICHHGPYINSIVKANSESQIKNIIEYETLIPKFDVFIEELNPDCLDVLAFEVDEMRETYD